MNKFEFDILRTLYTLPNYNQRLIAKKTGYSLGLVNKTIQKLIADKYLNVDCSLREWGNIYLEANKPKHAVILAAGYGMRMVPINTETPKGLLTIKNETLIERLIKQLHEVNIYDIDVVVGYMKEKYEFLIDEYDIHLVFNKDYSSKNNLFSLAKVVDSMSNSYIMPCDIYFKENPFQSYEGYSWYLLSKEISYNSFYTVNRKFECKLCPSLHDGNRMIGLAYFHNQDTAELKSIINDMLRYRENNNKFWEESLRYVHFPVFANIYSQNQFSEIDTFEDYMNLENDAISLSSNALNTIMNVFDVDGHDIKNIKILKKGMTNHSFQFSVHDKLYVMRVPEKDTNDIVNRYSEKDNLKAIKDEPFTDQVIYLDEATGYKISRWIEHDHLCDSNNMNDVQKCMRLLKSIHDKKYLGLYYFDIFQMINLYERKWAEPSYFRDYENTKKNIFSLKKQIEENVETKTLCHIDPVSDNFLIDDEKVYLIDWEYAAIQDPHIDIAMFCLDAMYDKEKIDYVIDLYFENKCKDNIRKKIYAYISCCGLMWSNWAEYKRGQGIEFGEYSLKMYRYAKIYYKYAKGGN